VKVSQDIVEFDLEPTAQGQDLNSSLKCFAADVLKAEGQYMLSGNLRGRGSGGDWLKTLSGHMEVMAKDGNIYHDIILLDLIKFLNVTEKLTGHMTEQKMETEGFGYHSFRIKTILKDGKIICEKAVLDGHPMTITAHGEHNLVDGQVNVSILVAPIKILDRVLAHVPIVGGILNTLDTIPISVKGSLSDIKILPLAPSAVAYELKELMENTVDIPVNLVHADEWRGIKSGQRP
jgi:uncharacterized protein YhdP